MKERSHFLRLISIASLTALCGFILSGPVALIMVKWIRPQPQWTSPSEFAANYHFIQDLPYWFGFILTTGMLMFSAAHYLDFDKKENALTKFHLLVALGWAVAFFTLISFNYICQTTYVRNLALHYSPEYDFAIAMFSMSNPMSFCWANEMWGYAFLGLSTLFGAGYYKTESKVIYTLMITNGIVSVAGAALTAIDTGWIMSMAGISSYVAWNILMIGLLLVIFSYSQRQWALEAP